MRNCEPNFDLRIAASDKPMVRSARNYEHKSRNAALVSVGLILERGSAARMLKSGGVFFVTELVLS